MTFHHLSAISTLGLFVLLPLTSSAKPSEQTTPTIKSSNPAPVNVSNTLPPSIADKLAKGGLRHDDISIWVKAVDEEVPVLSHFQDTPRTPASTQKLITTLIALDMMGGDYRWQTRLYADGVLLGGVLYGNLIIKGGADPSMTHDRLTAMLSQLTTKVKHITGDIIVDNLAFTNVADDVNAFDGQGLRAYNAQPNAFLVNFGTIEVNMIPSGMWEFASPSNPVGQTLQDDESIKTASKFRATSDVVAVQILPKLADFHAPTTMNGVASTCGGTNARPKFALSADTLVITGQVGIGCGQVSEWLTFADGDEFIKKAVKATWQVLDKNFVGQVRLQKPHDKVRPTTLPLISFASAPLSEQIYQINQYSNNVMTEQVALSLPLFLGQTSSDYPSSFAVIDAWWQQHLTTPKPIMTKASGLCRDCFVTAEALGELLVYGHKHQSHAVFKRSLPIVGQTGTMKAFAKRHPNSPAIGRAFIKTGRLNDVASIAGYVLGKSGRTYVVVAMVNADNAGNSTHAHDVLDDVIEWTAGQP